MCRFYDWFQNVTFHLIRSGYDDYLDCCIQQITHEIELQWNECGLMSFSHHLVGLHALHSTKIISESLYQVEYHLSIYLQFSVAAHYWDNNIWLHTRTLMPSAGIYDNLDTSFWHQSPHIWWYYTVGSFYHKAYWYKNWILRHIIVAVLWCQLFGVIMPSNISNGANLDSGQP